jgi:opacity protein-like surface antigen
MKRLIPILSLFLVLPVFAGTEMSHDSKDMKQMASETSDAGFYVAAYGGAQFATNYGNQLQTDDRSQQLISSGWGAVGGLKVGYNFESIPVNFMSLRLQPAVEAEGLYIGDNSHASNVFAASSSEHFSTDSGDFFVNGIIRFKNSSIVTPYIGIGVGLQYFSMHAENDVNVPGGGQFNFIPAHTVAVTGVDANDFDFAVQALFGLDVSICKHVSIFSEYKFVDAFNTDATCNNYGATGSTYHFRPDQIQQHLITAGVKYSF